MLEKIEISVGENLVFELNDGTFKTLKVVGVVQDTSTGAGDFLAPPFAFTDMDTMQTLRQSVLYNRVFATVAENPNDLSHIRIVGGLLRDRLERMERRSSVRAILNGTSIRWKMF
ncbi:MAG: hypothetical protein IPJ47_02270 [Anaerolineales bacterium]|nr:hypothetical protein [Anaerolineales bacterium]